VNPIDKFQALLEEIFQFEAADLDFGIYRILNYKRDQIEKFIQDDLQKTVEGAFGKHRDERLANIGQRLEEAKDKVIQALGASAILATGALKDDFKDTPVGREYLLVKAQKEEAEAIEEIRLQVFNDLYTFFSRYYEEGDFVPQYRYSIKNHRYAIPYNGEEVKLYWANHDQYYTKTGILFRDYAFFTDATKTYRVVFRTVAAKEEVGSNKATKARFFVLDDETPWEMADESNVIIRLQYRELTSDEAKNFGVEGGSNTGKQEKINGSICDTVLKGIKDVKLKGLLRAIYKNETGLLQYQLARFTAKNTKDYFIHKDLKAFLAEQLDYFIKAEVISLETLERERFFDKHITRAKVVREVGGKIIDFLAQIEDFQKKLWEKKKFVIRTDYVVTTDLVPEDFYPEILKNKAQLKEWKELGFDGDLPSKRGAKSPASGTPFVKGGKGGFAFDAKLPVDTKHFSQAFKENLLEKLTEKEDLDDLLDGLVIKSENWQGLNLLREKYRENVKCIYIDPPYNTGGDDFLYKDAYRHSSWISMILASLNVAHRTLDRKGLMYVSIDGNERSFLEVVLNTVFGGSNRVEEVIWVQNTTKNQSPTFSTNHEYVEVYAKDLNAAKQDSAMFREIKPGYREIIELVEKLNPSYRRTEEIESALRNLFAEHKAAIAEKLGIEANDPWKGIYNYTHAEYRDASGKYVPEQHARERNAQIWVWREDNPSMPQVKADSQKPAFRDPEDPGYRFYRPLHPVTGRECPSPKRGWSWPLHPHGTQRFSFSELAADHRIAWGSDETKIPQTKRFLNEVETNVSKSVVNDYTDGEKELTNLFGKTRAFSNPKPTTLISRFCQQATSLRDVVLDFFCGSGPTAHAVINLNRDDGGRRKYILIEMANYFETVLMPRIKKVIYSDKWKDGKPQNTNGISHFMKYQYLEQYEDTLDNIELKPRRTAQNLFGDDYLLKYFVDFETRENATLLRMEDLKKPFSYRLKVNAEEVGEPKEVVVDIPETFNYLIGLKLRKFKARAHKGAKYEFTLGEKEGKNVAVVWREYDDSWTEARFMDDKAFIIGELEEWAPHVVYINGQSVLTPQLGEHSAEIRQIEPDFKALMGG
jgi:adenine-specific DNA-methyltransferase